MSGIIDNTGASSGVVGQTEGGVDHSTMFRAHTASGQAPTMTHTVWTKMLFATKTYDIGVNFNTSNSEYTVPSSGYYSFIAQIGFYSGNLTNAMLKIYVNGSSAHGAKGATGRAEIRIVNMSYFMTVPHTSYLVAGDTIRVYGYIEEGSGSPASSLYTGDGFTFFSGYKISN